MATATPQSKWMGTGIPGKTIPRKAVTAFKKRLFKSEKGQLVRVHVSAVAGEHPVSDISGLASLTFERSVKGIKSPVKITVLGSPAQLAVLRGKRITGFLSVFHKMDVNGKETFCCEIRYVPNAKPTHKLKVHSLISELDTTLKVTEHFPAGKGVIAVVEMD